MQNDIVLIPKILKPTSTSHFRYISLCNFVYTIILKVMSSRLKVCLTKLITLFQSIFIASWQIQDNMIIAHETFHSLRNKTQLGREAWSVKVDIQKSYYKVEQGFLDTVMMRLSFNDAWIGWVRKRVSQVEYRAVLNGRKQIHIISAIPRSPPKWPPIVVFVQIGIKCIVENDSLARRSECAKWSEALPHMFHHSPIVLCGSCTFLRSIYDY